MKKMVFISLIYSSIISCNNYDNRITDSVAFIVSNPSNINKAQKIISFSNHLIANIKISKNVYITHFNKFNKKYLIKEVKHATYANDNNLIAIMVYVTDKKGRNGIQFLYKKNKKKNILILHNIILSDSDIINRK